MHQFNQVVEMYNRHAPFPGLYRLILNKKNVTIRGFLEFFLKRRLNKKKFIQKIIRISGLLLLWEWLLDLVGLPV